MRVSVGVDSFGSVQIQSGIRHARRPYDATLLRQGIEHLIAQTAALATNCRISTAALRKFAPLLARA